jgi:hypothetical protein
MLQRLEAQISSPRVTAGVTWKDLGIGDSSDSPTRQ